MKAFLGLWILGGYVTMKVLLTWKVAAFIIILFLVLIAMVIQACVEGESNGRS